MDQQLGKHLDKNMDRTIALTGAGVLTTGVLCFAVCMLVGVLAGCYLGSIAIAWGLLACSGAFLRFSRPEAKLTAVLAVAFGGMYAFCNTMVYFIQLSTVRNAVLSAEALMLLDYGKFGMMFDLDLLGYCLMAVCTFFAGLTIDVRDRGDAWLKALLMIHGVFAITCFVLPILGLFNTNMQGANWIGTAIMEFWCVFFLPVGILTIRYFARQRG